MNLIISLLMLMNVDGILINCLKTRYYKSNTLYLIESTNLYLPTIQPPVANLPIHNKTCHICIHLPDFMSYCRQPLKAHIEYKEGFN